MPRSPPEPIVQADFQFHAYVLMANPAYRVLTLANADAAHRQRRQRKLSQNRFILGVSNR